MKMKSKSKLYESHAFGLKKDTGKLLEGEKSIVGINVKKYLNLGSIYDFKDQKKTGAK